MSGKTESPAAVDRLQAKIAALEKEAARWQESSGQNYSRAQDAEDREEKLERRIAELETALDRERLNRIRLMGGRGMSIKAGDYVIVRCKNAGVHAGVLVGYDGRTAELTESRRLWYWRVANNGAFLSGIAVHGLHPDSKVGVPIDVVLTETCEIIRVSESAAESIISAVSYKT